MGGGGKSRKVESTQNVNLPPGLEQGANEVLAAGLRSASLPYSPNRGVTVAAFTPQQVKAMQGANTQAEAFGLEAAPIAYPTPEVSDQGILGYSTGAMYDKMVDRSTTPEQRAERQGLLQSFRNASGRVYDAANIDPLNPGTQPYLSGDAPPPTPPDDPSPTSEELAAMALMPGSAQGGSTSGK